MKKIIFSAAVLAAVFATAQNTGIGTTNPETKLDVRGETRVNYLSVRPQDSNNEGGEMQLYGSGKNVNTILDNFSGNFRIFDTQYLSPRFYIQTSSGFVGINNSNPLANLDVMGTFRLNDGSQGAGKILVSDGQGIAKWQSPAAIPTYSGSTSVVLNSASFERAALTGDVTAAQNSNATTIAPNAVTSAKIADGTIAAADLSAMGATAPGQNLVWNGTAWAPTTPTAANSANIYTTDGVLGGNRTVTMGNNSLVFAGSGNFGIGSAELRNNRLTVNGVGTGANQSTIKVTTPGSTLAERSGIGFYSTFGGGTSDTGPRRSADIISGYNGAAWGTEYLSFNVGSATDASNLTSEKMRIQSDGNIGIGTVAPKAKLDIAGNIKITDGTQGANKILTSDANGLATWQTPAAIPTYTGSGSVILNGNSFERAALTGDVTSAQNSNTTTIAPNAVTSSKIADGTIAAADLSAMGATNAGQTLTWNGSSWVPTTPTVTNIYTADGTLLSNRNVGMGNNNLAFTGNGNVGIGVAAPAAKLDVKGSVKIADGSQGNGRILTSDANGNASWQTQSFPPPSLGAPVNWDLPSNPNAVDPNNTVVTYGPYNVSTTGWYSLISRWFFEQNPQILNSDGKLDEGSANFWLQINTDSTNNMDGVNLAYENRAVVNLMSANTTMGIIFLDKNQTYYIHQSTKNTKWAGTGERKFLLRLLNGQ